MFKGLACAVNGFTFLNVMGFVLSYFCFLSFVFCCFFFSFFFLEAASIYKMEILHFKFAFILQLIHAFKSKVYLSNL